MLHFVLASIGFVLGVFLLIDLVDKIAWSRANPLSLPNVLAKPAVADAARSELV